ncbi:ribonuclease P protein component [Acetobacterium wieringae]|uniref:Ribonuclease P protein component n=1 Tax=Acetobacterium wieringae TaxID=52694 RepID=A0A1F2PJY0_9FIRM|nr:MULTISPECIES: ribonuclease P protein component [Acetobacterium]MEA4805461.1 ribonuclease P protein component [Acetobacterium wieringae]OFV71204.1 ribonuclease P protein component [Acetobacterium wieringae]OXS26336.1 MAG: ribonuclease P protein component [Acetobacterium sp. MES1]TYC87237.1 ribonuclease P protein component [Acetobacterium wieringae]URN84440.1 ribonuclease P protein component [Acetobacterium wieringae]
MVKIKSLSKENEFKRVFKVGDVFGNKVFVIYYLKNEENFNRLGIIVSKKVSKKAVIRNKVKRRIKEAYRLNEDSFSKGYDIILIAKESIKEVPYSSLEKSLNHLFYKKNLMRP